MVNLSTLPTALRAKIDSMQITYVVRANEYSWMETPSCIGGAAVADTRRYSSEQTNEHLVKKRHKNNQNQWRYRQTGGWIDGWMDRWTDRLTDGWTKQQMALVFTTIEAETDIEA